MALYQKPAPDATPDDKPITCYLHDQNIGVLAEHQRITGTPSGRASRVPIASQRIAAVAQAQPSAFRRRTDRVDFSVDGPKIVGLFHDAEKGVYL